MAKTQMFTTKRLLPPSEFFKSADAAKVMKMLQENRPLCFFILKRPGVIDTIIMREFRPDAAGEVTRDLTPEEANKAIASMNVDVEVTAAPEEPVEVAEEQKADEWDEEKGDFVEEEPPAEQVPQEEPVEPKEAPAPEAPAEEQQVLKEGDTVEYKGDGGSVETGEVLAILNDAEIVAVEKSTGKKKIIKAENLLSIVAAA
jgi:hypothetical protein